MSADRPALAVDAVSHRYGDRLALDGVSFDVAPGEIFALLGPNGGGKTTLFRIAATVMRPTEGTVRVLGDDVVAQPARVRRHLGVVFQSPALDPVLTVRENLVHHGHLYGLRGAVLDVRLADVLDRLGLAARARDRVGRLSGGLMRRVELAKALVASPAVLLLDEPSTGLDPVARRDLWDQIGALSAGARTTVVVTTHLMDEAARADRVAIIDRGRIVAAGRPAELTATVGGDVVWISAPHAESLAARVGARFGSKVDIVDGRLRLERPRGHEFLTDLIETFPGEIDAVTVSRPTLDDVFVHHTGHRLD